MALVTVNVCTCDLGKQTDDGRKRLAVIGNTFTQKRMWRKDTLGRNIKELQNDKRSLAGRGTDRNIKIDWWQGEA